MSLRDDLEHLIARAAPTHYASDTQYAIDKLRAALTPAAIKWLEALPELMELEKQATPYHLPGLSFTARHSLSGTIMQWNPEDLKLWQRTRDVIHEAAALHNATDEKEQK